MKLSLWTDGGVRTGGVNGPTKGQSGRGAIGFVIKDEAGTVLRKSGMPLEGNVTVNECEYSGLIAGLYNCHTLGATHVTVYMDSQLVVNQMNKKWACRDMNLREYQSEAQEQIEQFESVEIVWVRRENNQHADSITREILNGD